MAMPSTAIVRYDLSKPFTEFDLAMNQKGYIGPRVLRPRLTGIQAGDFSRIKLEHLLQQQNTKRASGAGYKRGQWEFTKDSFATEEFGWEETMDDRELAIYADLIEADQVSADRAMGFVYDEFERDIAASIYDTAVWTGAALTTAITNEWDDATNATPIADVFAAKEKVRDGTGLDANALIMNTFQFHHLINTNQIVERLKYVKVADQSTLAASVAEIIGIEEIIVAGGVKNTANPQQTRSISRIWSNEYVMVARVARTDDPKEPCVGRTLIWTGDGPNAVGTDEKLAMIVEEYREENRRGSVMRARNDRDIKIIYAAAGHLLSNAITI